ncbi:cell division protein ZapA [Methylocella sp. CPCC 101449]|jgi:cell division protein ZapA|uniref:cell division protein ZapA n=1 Tax=Methylocella sp. CPCC 101449 TaxID=2987531 RepID=UPI00288F2AE4|nr:cell division protein ZapA [Methylocella sp. CPCC 101449]MDT2021000.1 cell division protein ZapA [Methylocella sp. CPCC 101449]HEV2570743.1 cell division protein ZapA [Beijerinckiaceae bacterium]
MAQITVTVGGRPYRMACADGEEEHLESLARLVDDRIGELRSSFGEIGDQRLTVMAAISIADELSESTRKVTRLNGEIDDLNKAQEEAQDANASAAESAADRLENIAARIERLAQVMNNAGKSPQ